MIKKLVIYLFMSCMMVLPLVTVSCGTTNETGGKITEEDTGQTITTEGEEQGTQEGENQSASSELTGQPQYGGTITLPLNADPIWDLLGFGAAWPQMLAHQRLIDGNWAKGIAGGYGDSLTTWGQSTNIPDLNTGYLASDYHWEVSENGSEVTTYFTVRDDVYFAQVDSEAGRMVDGRKVTVDDIVWNLNQRIHNENAQNYQLYPDYRYPVAVKTGPDTFTITHKFNDHLGAIMRENVSTTVFPPELWDAYGYDSCTNWEYSVGTGPFMITDYVPSNMVELERNPNYWMSDPVGPGKGNQLPYIGKVRYIIIQDASTRLAAIRTGRIDQISNLNPEDKDQMLKTAPDLEVAARGSWQITPLFMRTDKMPFNDINVRKALLMATDFNEINNGLYQGLGDIISWPYFNVKGYEPLYVSLDDPDCSDAIKELYTYNPEKARQLLADAGYPSGFKASLVLTQDGVDYYSIIKDMWSQVGVDLNLDVVADYGALMGVANSIGYEDMISIGTSPNSSYPEQALYAARNWVNCSLINEKYVDEEAEKVRALAVTDFQASMELCRPLCMYLIEKAYMVPSPRYPTYAMWWPWLKNYSGETSVGYFPGDSWVQWVWLDQNEKDTLGY